MSSTISQGQGIFTDGRNRAKTTPLLSNDRPLHRLTANAVTLFHFLWSIVIFGGGILMLFVHAYAPFQIATMTLTVAVNLPFKGRCPFTMLEERLRQKTDPSYTNRNSFATTYLNKFLGTNFRVRNVNLFMGAFYVASYVSALWIIFRW